MDELGYVFDVVSPWLERYHASGPAALSHRETVAVGVWLLDADVNNDGFGQYYANSAGVLAHSTVDALRKIGALEREYYEEREGRMGLLAHYLRRTEPGGR